MDKIIALTRQQREAILQHLTANQVQALSEFTRYAMLSRFHTHHYLKQTDWEFQGMVIDPWYQRQHDHHHRQQHEKRQFDRRAAGLENDVDQQVHSGKL